MEATWTTLSSSDARRCAPPSGWPPCASTFAEWGVRRAPTPTASPSVSTSRPPSLSSAKPWAADEIGLIGYSFGAAVAAQVAATGAKLAGLGLIAPPLALEGLALPPPLGRLSSSILVVAGTQDQYCPTDGAAEGLRAIRERADSHRGGREPLLLRQAVPSRRNGRSLGPVGLRARHAGAGAGWRCQLRR